MNKTLLAISFAMFSGDLCAQEIGPVDLNTVLKQCTEATNLCAGVLDDALGQLEASPPEYSILPSILAQLAAIAINTARIDPTTAEDMSAALRKIAAMSFDQRQVETLLVLADEISDGGALDIDLTAFAASPS